MSRYVNERLWKCPHPFMAKNESGIQVCAHACHFLKIEIDQTFMHVAPGLFLCSLQCRLMGELRIISLCYNKSV